MVSEIPATGSVNSSIDISGLASNRIYYYRAVFSIGQTIVIKGNFTTPQCKYEERVRSIILLLCIFENKIVSYLCIYLFDLAITCTFYDLQSFSFLLR